MSGSPLVMLLRHGTAEAVRAGSVDEERGLTGDGRHEVQELATGMRMLALSVDVVLTSPLRRAEETARIVANVHGVTDRLEVLPALSPGGAPEAVVRSLSACDGASGVVLVGHEPDLGELASILLSGTPGLVKIRFQTGGVAGIRLAQLPPCASGVLEFLWTARQFRPLDSSG